MFKRSLYIYIYVYILHTHISYLLLQCFCIDGIGIYVKCVWNNVILHKMELSKAIVLNAKHNSTTIIISMYNKSSAIVSNIIYLIYIIFLLCYRDNITALETFHLQISKLELYPKNSKIVDQLLYNMATKPIFHVGKFLYCNKLMTLRMSLIYFIDRRLQA